MASQVVPGRDWFMRRPSTQGPADAAARPTRKLADGVAQRFVDGAFLGEPHGLEGEGARTWCRRPCRRCRGRCGWCRRGRGRGRAGEQPEDEAAGDVDDEGAPRERAAGVVLHSAVEQVAGGGADGGGDEERDPGGRAHVPLFRPTYLTTSTSSRTTSPSVMSSSRSGRNAAMASGLSTMTMAIGRSSDSDRMRVVWMWLEAP